MTDFLRFLLPAVRRRQPPRKVAMDVVTRAVHVAVEHEVNHGHITRRTADRIRVSFQREVTRG